MVKKRLYGDRYWWAKEKNECHEALCSTVRALDQNLGLEAAHARLLSTLLNRHYSELRPGKITFDSDAMRPKNRLVINATQNILETLTSRICTGRPRPRFVTRDGVWKEKRKAQRLDQYVQGIFQSEKVYIKTAQAFKDAGWTGTGFIKVCENPNEPGSVLVERVFPLEILVDQQACFQGAAPRTIYQRKWVASEVLAAAYPDHDEEIHECRSVDKEYTETSVIATDLVMVVEAWHLPSSSASEDGRHVICIDKATLLDEGWDSPFLPFAVLRWTDIPVGFYGQGLVEQQEAIQLELNKMAGRFQEAMHLLGTAWVSIPEGAVKEEHLRNLPGSIIKVQPGFEDKIRVIAPQPMPAMAFDYMDWLYSKEHETSAVNQMSASGQKPSGVRAAAALRELRDEQTERFGMYVRAWEQFHLDVAELIIMVSKRMYSGLDTATDYAVKYVDKGFYRSIKWADVDLARDSYVLQLWPSNLLPSTPAGKLATTEELMAAGLIDMNTAMTLLDFPDVERSQSLISSTVDFADYVVDELFDGRRPDVPPIALVDPLTIIQRLGWHYLRAQMDGAPNEALANLRNYIGSIQSQMEEVQAARDALEQAQQMGQQNMPATPDGPAQVNLTAPAEVAQ
jgi:hypothetical protein